MLKMVVSNKNRNSLKIKRMHDLLKKEKELHKEIRQDYKKISEKIINDFDKIQRSKSRI